MALAVLFNVPDVGSNADNAPGDIVFGAFVIAQTMVTHVLDRRFAFRIH